ncbi:MAG: hypothetical protein LBS63_04035, partial [Prevotellaceae bacterium]|jgi:hypothetical protein|nr:hypothetical protein [Prevotellaceae bacterium]
MENQNLAEMKAKIKNEFVEINEDKFTKVKTVTCKKVLRWDNNAKLDRKARNVIISEFTYSSLVGGSWGLNMAIDYRCKTDVDAVFFMVEYRSSDANFVKGGYLGMENLKLYLILDDDKTIEMQDVSGISRDASTQNVPVVGYVNTYVECAQLSCNVADFIQIANAKKIEYSIRIGGAELHGTFPTDAQSVFKGLYNGAFDEEFEVENLSGYIEKKGKKKRGKRITWLIILAILTLLIGYCSYQMSQIP